MIDILYGQALHSYFLKIEVESPDGILETQVRPVVSQHNLFTLHGQEGLSKITQEAFEQVRSQVPVSYSVAVRIVVDRLNCIVMN